MSNTTLRFFKEDEFKCKCGCGQDVTQEFKAMMDLAREYAGTPFVINSGARCPDHNAKPHVGGSATSSHMKGIAADVAFKSELQRDKVIFGLAAAGFTRLGINDHKNFIHVDMDPQKPDALWHYQN